MTVEFYKKKRDIAAWRKHILDDFKTIHKKVPKDQRKKFKRDMEYHRKKLKIVRVRVVDSRKLATVGGRKYGAKRGPIRKGEIGYVFAWRGMKREAGLQKVR